MAAVPPPWRVFDAPAGETTSLGDTTPGGEASDAEGSPTGLAGSLAQFVRPGVLAGLGAALGGLVLAVVLATNGGSGITVDATNGGPLGAGASGEAPGATGGTLVVDVAGAVLRPGVYRLPDGSRVADAIAAAGGYGPRVAADRVDREINLAALVRDGDRILVPSRDDATAGWGSGGSAGSGSNAGGGASATLIDLNTATEAELDTLPGIGPVTAAKIVAARQEAPFRSVDELLERKVVGPATFDKIKVLVTVR